MKQVLQNLRTGQTEVVEVPAPGPAPGRVLVRTEASLISAGTERMLVEFGQASLLGKARAQPDKVKQVLDKIRTDGLLPTLETVFNRLDEPLPLGYCNVGTVVEAGRGVHDLAPGDRVASNGPHAEFVSVPRRLCSKVPAGVSVDTAAFTVLGSIGLQAIRLAAPTLGETVAVMGMGLVGLVTAQLLIANGCRVLATDVNADRLALAASYGCTPVNVGAGGDPVVVAHALTGGRGVDAVLIAASAKSDDIVHQAAEMCRTRGRIVLVGVVGLNLRRSDFYAKELSFSVSCSYGPGRYDASYEEVGHDYPYGLVRWTAERNFEAVLETMRTGRLTIDALVTHRFPLPAASSAYQAVQRDPRSLGVLLTYPADAPAAHSIAVAKPDGVGGVRLATAEGAHPAGADTGPVAQPGPVADGSGLAAPAPPGVESSEGHWPAPDTSHGSAGHGSRPSGKASTRPTRPVVAVVGPGNFAKMTLMPALAKAKAEVRYVVGRSNPAAAQHLAAKFGVPHATTDYTEALADPAVSVMAITTRSDSHVPLAIRALEAGKHVFVEKPAAVDDAGLGALVAAARKHPELQFVVGFNRRHSPHVQRLRQLLSGRGEPLAMHYMANAGVIAASHWVHDREANGGRIVGEACHFVDVLAYLAGAPVVSVAASQMGGGVAVREDKMSIVLTFGDGSVGTVDYFANGSRQYPKETLEVYSEGRVARVDNYRQTRLYGFGRAAGVKTWSLDKGHEAQFALLLERVRTGGPQLMEPGEWASVTSATLAAMEAATRQRVITLDPIAPLAS